VCPTRAMTSSSTWPTRTRSPSSSGRSTGTGSAAASGRPAAVRAPVADTTSANACQWSRCWWVVTTCPRLPVPIRASRRAGVVRGVDQSTLAGLAALQQVGVVVHRPHRQLGQSAGRPSRGRLAPLRGSPLRCSSRVVLPTCHPFGRSRRTPPQVTVRSPGGSGSDGSGSGGAGRRAPAPGSQTHRGAVARRRRDEPPGPLPGSGPPATRPAR
jgi:hypothetical protein